MNFSRRTLIKGLSASAAAHTLGTFKSFASPLSSSPQELVVFQFGHAEEDHFQHGLQMAMGSHSAITMVKTSGDWLANLDLLRHQLQQHPGKRAVAFLDHAQHAIFQELLRETRVKLWQVGNHSWSKDPVQHSHHRVLSATDPSYAQTLAQLMSATGWNFRLESSTLAAQGPSEVPCILRASESAAKELTHHLPICHIPSLLGYALGCQAFPTRTPSTRELTSLQSTTPTSRFRPDSAVTLLMEF